MNLWQSLLFFGLPGLAIFSGLNLGVPIATNQGVPLIVSWSVALWLPVLLPLVWVLLRASRNTPRPAWGQRFRLKRMERRHWVLVLLAFVALQICELVLSTTAAFFAQLPLLPIPSVIPELFDPRINPEAGLETFFGIPVAGNWWLVLVWLVWLVVNIGGEEILWRGYALPLQERVFGSKAWIVNGLCWNLLIHAFMWWNFLTLMPISLAIPYLVQRYQNTWIGIYIHGFGNLLVLAILIPSVAGWL